MTSKSKLLAWRKVGAITIVFCLIFGLLFFCFIVPYVDQRMDLRPAAAVVCAGIGLLSLVIIYGITVWLRRNKRGCKRAEVDAFVPYDLRRTTAIYLLESCKPKP
jgi:quinol-cytochrome oxidoreductase complex cytochrome b subunit